MIVAYLHHLKIAIVWEPLPCVLHLTNAVRDLNRVRMISVRGRLLLWKNALAVLHLHFKSELVRFQLGLMTDLPGSLLCDLMNASRALHHLSKSDCLDLLLLMTGLLDLLLLMTAPLVPCPHLLLIELSSLRPLMTVV